MIGSLEKESLSLETREKIERREFVGSVLLRDD